MKNHIIPFFVADRPASLRILKGILLKYPNIKIGIMTHAFTSNNLWRIFNDFPFSVPLLYEEPNLLKNEDLLSESLIKMTDSGIFCKTGCTIDYEELFDRYNIIGTDFGIMIDVLKNSKETIKSAEMALRIYKKGRRKFKFKLVAVAQGNTLEEYLDCYRQLSKNFEYIAVGGLLKKRENTARYVNVRDENFLYNILGCIRYEFNPQWLFALGCYHPSRHKNFEKLGIWGSDYKGWIFQYKQKRQLIKNISSYLTFIEAKNGSIKELNELKKKVERIENELLEKEKEWRQTKEKPIKRALWGKINLLKVELAVETKRLLMEREQLACRNQLPREYKDELKRMEEIIEEKEQSLRFRQVREYIDLNVYGQLQ